MSREPSFVLALALSARGFGFVVFAEPNKLFDWGVKEMCGRARNAYVLAAIKKIVATYQPQTIVIEDTDARDCRRGSRNRSLYRSVGQLAYREEIIVKRYTNAQVRAVFGTAGLRTKNDIARAVAARIPAFAHRLPPVRKPWMPEDHRQPLFDAAALGIVHFAARAARLSHLRNES